MRVVVQSGWIAVCVAIVAWSLSPFLVLQMAGLAPAPLLALAAVATGSLLALVVSSFTKNRNPKAMAQQIRSGRIPLHKAAFVGLGSFVAYPLLYFSAIQAGPAVLVNLVNYLWPIVGIAIVATFRKTHRSLELTLSGAFGLAGAALAITAAGTAAVSGKLEWLPFLAAGAGALVYGAVSAYANLRRKSPDEDPLSFLLVSLFCGGFVCIVLTLLILLVGHGSIPINVTPSRMVAFALYSGLLPCAHLSWLYAVGKATVPSFASAFVVPVLATALLAVVSQGYAGPQILAALTLVICATALSAPYAHGIPVAFAITLSVLGSILISETFPQAIAGGFDSTVNLYQQPLVSLLAILSGFVLSNAIRRYDKLQDFILAFFAKARSVLGGNPEQLEAEIAALERMVIESTRLRGYQTETVGPSPGSVELTDQWASVKAALGNRISGYEWMVLLLNTAGVVLVLHVSSLTSTQLTTLLLRASATGVVVGVLFAVRDYDLNRPERAPRMLNMLRAQYGIPSDGSGAEPSRIESRSYSSAGLLGLALLIALAVAAIAWNAATH